MTDPNLAYTPENAVRDFIRFGRYDWYETESQDRLHWADLTADNLAAVWEEWRAEGPIQLACGQTVHGLWIPGFGSRLSTPRCTGCCGALGYPHGDGSPKNDDRCRELMGLPPAEEVEHG